MGGEGEMPAGGLFNGGDAEPDDMIADGGPGSGRKPEGGSKKEESNRKKTRKYVDNKVKKEYNNAVKGIRMPNGIVVKQLTSHALERALERGYSSKDIKNVLENQTLSYPGNKSNKDCTVYQNNNMRIVLGNDGNVVSIVKLEED